MSSIRSILEEKLKQAYFNGSTDVIARQNGVIPNNTKLGEVQIEVLVDQVLLEISELIEKEVIGKRDDGKNFMKMSGYAKRKILIEYGIRVNQLIALKELLK